MIQNIFLMFQTCHIIVFVLGASGLTMDHLRVIRVLSQLKQVNTMHPWMHSLLTHTLFLSASWCESHDSVDAWIRRLNCTLILSMAWEMYTDFRNACMQRFLFLFLHLSLSSMYPFLWLTEVRVEYQHVKAVSFERSTANGDSNANSIEEIL